MIEAVRRTAKQLVKAGILLYSSPHYLLGRFETVRNMYSRARALSYPIGASELVGIGELYGQHFSPQVTCDSGIVISDSDPAEHLKRLRTSSFSDGIRLKPSAVSELRLAAESLPLQSASRQSLTYTAIKSSPQVQQDVALATVAGSSRLPLIRKLAADRLLVTTASLALGYHPQKVSSWFFWSFVNSLSIPEREARNQTVRFHYDVDGFNFVYVSFYLLDTDQNTGAHVLLAGTHKGKRIRHLLGSARIDDEEAGVVYGNHCVRIIEGGAGAGFFEDASCYHKALPPLRGERLILQLRYQ